MRPLGLTLLVSAALAAPPPGGVSVSPARVELALAPGETREVVFTVGGEGEYLVGTVLFTMRGEEVAVSGEACPHLRPETPVVRVRGATQVKVGLEAPQTPGTTACLLTLTPTAGAQTPLAVGVPVYLTLKGTERPGLGIAVLRDGRVVVENTGNVLLRLSGFVSYVEEGREVARQRVRDFALLPGNARVLPPPEGLQAGQAVVYLEGGGKRWAKQGAYRR